MGGCCAEVFQTHASPDSEAKKQWLKIAPKHIARRYLSQAAHRFMTIASIDPKS